ncbi:hypothetical protein Tco_0412076 [Tanacetum coccineum]
MDHLIMPEVPPSPDYIPGPEGPPSPDYVLGPEEPEQAPPSPIYIPFVPEPIYPEFLTSGAMEVFRLRSSQCLAADSLLICHKGIYRSPTLRRTQRRMMRRILRRIQPTILLTEDAGMMEVIDDVMMRQRRISGIPTGRGLDREMHYNLLFMRTEMPEILFAASSEPCRYTPVWIRGRWRVRQLVMLGRRRMRSFIPVDDERFVEPLLRARVNMLYRDRPFHRRSAL